MPFCTDYLVSNLHPDTFCMRYNKACNLEIVYLDTLAIFLNLLYLFITSILLQKE